MKDLIRFYRAIPDARPPMLADKSAVGALPTKAFRYCEPARAASGYGWYIGPPHDFSLRWNGHTSVEWWFGEEYGGVLEGEHVQAIQYPDFAEEFDQIAPDFAKGYSPPFITAFQEPGIVQIWSGWLVRTARDWSVHVRAVANRPRPTQAEPFEGIIETDDWFGPLIINLRLAQTEAPIHFPAHRPLFQMQLVPRVAYQGPHATETRELAAWDADDWQAYYATVVVPHTARGAYALRSRQRPAQSLEEFSTCPWTQGDVT